MREVVGGVIEYGLPELILGSLGMLIYLACRHGLLDRRITF